MSPNTLARILHDSRANRSGRRPPLLPKTRDDRVRVSTFDLSLRLRSRGFDIRESELRAAMDALKREGAVSYGDGGWTLDDLDALARVAR